MYQIQKYIIQQSDTYPIHIELIVDYRYVSGENDMYRIQINDDIYHDISLNLPLSIVDYTQNYPANELIQPNDTYPIHIANDLYDI